MRIVCALSGEARGSPSRCRVVLDHLIDAARDVATGGGAHGHSLANMEFVEHGVSQFCDELAPLYSITSSTREELWRHVEPERLGFEVDDQLELGWRLHR